MENCNNNCQCGCQECLEMLEIFLDNETTPEQKEQIKAHIDSCEKCRTCYQTNSQFRKKLQGVLKEKVTKKCPSELMTCIQNKIKELAF